ncbi:MAG: GIY-YIG nuclease family protein [Patescibacteria group bacterium]|nr:GIY-YIG nuclease family protein [Patescibacteria group bacterium]
MYYIYILKSLKTKELYKGLTNNMARRLKQHFSGRVKSTRGKRPLKVVHVEICQNRASARRTEKLFKSGYGREIIRELLNC